MLTKEPIVLAFSRYISAAKMFGFSILVGWIRSSEANNDLKLQVHTAV